MNQRIVKVASPSLTAAIFGAFDANTRIIEGRFSVSLRNRSGEDGSDAIVISGESMESVNRAAAAVEYLREYISGKIARLPQIELPSELIIRESVTSIKRKE